MYILMTMHANGQANWMSIGKKNPKKCLPFGGKIKRFKKMHTQELLLQNDLQQNVKMACCWFSQLQYSGEFLMSTLKYS